MLQRNVLEQRGKNMVSKRERNRSKVGRCWFFFPFKLSFGVLFEFLRLIPFAKRIRPFCSV